MSARAVRRRWQPLVRAFIRVVLAGLTGLLHRLSWSAGAELGERLGRWAFWLLPRERRRARSQLTRALGAEQTPAAIEGIARACFGHLGRTLAEVLNLDRLDRAQLDALIEIDPGGLEVLRSALALGRGLLFVTGHVGNWEMMAAYVAAHGFPVNVVAAPIYDPAIETIMVGLRRRFGANTIPRGGRAGAKALLAALRRNGIVGLLIDQDTRVDGMPVPFFGRLAYTPSGPAAIALRRGTPVVVGFATRQANGRHRITISAPLPLPLPATGDRERDLERHTARLTQLIEQQIRTHPEQWVWMHNRWKRTA